MAHLRIEMDRGTGWEVRSEGDVASATLERIEADLRSYAIQYPHRAWLDGRLVAEVRKPNRLRRAAVIRL